MNVYRDIKDGGQHSAVRCFGEYKYAVNYIILSCLCVCSANCIAGRMCTKVTREKECCCRMGSLGGLVCLVTLPFSFYHPIASMAGFCCLSNHIRAQVIQQYDVEEEKNFCCGPCNPWLDYCHFGCNYPCSFFQMEMSIEEWDAAIAANSSVSIVAPVHAQPIATTKQVYH